MEDSTHEIAINSKHHGYQKGLASIVYKLFYNKTRTGVTANVNDVLAQELCKPVIKKFKEEKCMRGLKIIFGQQI